MENKKQNASIERAARRAAAGGGFDWNRTVISTTERAAIDDPFRDVRRTRSWRQEYDDRQFVSMLMKSGALDSADPRTEAEKWTDTNSGADEGTWQKYKGAPGDDAFSWLGELATKVDVNTDAHAPWFAALQSYVAKMPAGSKCGDLDESLLTQCLTQLCQ